MKIMVTRMPQLFEAILASTNSSSALFCDVAVNLYGCGCCCYSVHIPNSSQETH